MPIYEYECRKCKKSFDYIQRMSEAPKVKCEDCGGKLEKKISPAGFILKGGGWYKDLYASPKPGSGSDTSEGTSAKAQKADKPAATSDKAASAPVSTQTSKKAKAE